MHDNVRQWGTEISLHFPTGGYWPQLYHATGKYCDPDSSASTSLSAMAAMSSVGLTTGCFLIAYVLHVSSVIAVHSKRDSICRDSKRVTEMCSQMVTKPERSSTKLGNN